MKTYWRKVQQFETGVKRGDPEAVEMLVTFIKLLAQHQALSGDTVHGICESGVGQGTRWGLLHEFLGKKGR